MKTLTDQLRALAAQPEFEDTTTAKLFLDLAARADAIEAENAKLRAALSVIDRDFKRNGASISNYSDGEYTQDYTTRAATVERALKA